MKLTVNDFFEALDSEQGPSAERIKVLTMAKIENAKPAAKSIRPLRRIAIAAAAVFMLSAAVYAVYSWTGFASTEAMSQEEIQALMDQIEMSGYTQSFDKDGNVHYYDSTGAEFMVLSPEELVQFERARREEQKKQNLENAQGLLDPRTLTAEPRSITPLSTRNDGTFDDFLLSNGSLVLLQEGDHTGYDLRAGDSVTISITASDICIMEFGMVQNGSVLETETIRSEDFSKTFTIPEDGIYCFTLMYFSSDCDNFTDCSILID